jgi:putative redox protein
MNVQVTWRENLFFTGATENGSVVPLGSRGDGGEQGGPSPMEMIALGLIGCTAMDVISILQKKRQQVTDFMVEAHVERAADHPRVFTHVIIQYHVTGKNVDPSAVLRSIELSATKYCPAHAMLSQVTPIELKYHVYETGDGQVRKLVTSGEYSPE